MILAKSTKSLQVMLNETIPTLGCSVMTVTNTAYSKARKKFRHTAFIELNSACVLLTVYEDGDYRTFAGMRLLAVDGSRIILPNNASTKATFGTTSNAGFSSGQYCFGQASVLFDVLNGVCLDAKLAHSRSYEVDLAVDVLDCLQDDDLVIMDRNYCSFHMAAQATAAKGNFLIRCPSNASVVVRDMLQGKGPDDVLHELRPVQGAQKRQGYSKPLTVRYVRVVLDTGENEVLMTSLLDQEQFPTSIFKDLYWKRWGIETFYGILKGRLDLENFTGLSAESVLQDFHAAVFLTGMEAIFVADANEELAARPTKHDYQVNKAVSFNAIKNQAFDLLFSKVPLDQMIEELDELFLTNPVAVRKDRKNPRTTTDRRRLQFWKRRRKSVY